MMKKNFILFLLRPQRKWLISKVNSDFEIIQRNFAEFNESVKYISQLTSPKDCEVFEEECKRISSLLVDFLGFIREIDKHITSLSKLDKKNKDIAKIQKQIHDVYYSLDRRANISKSGRNSGSIIFDVGYMNLCEVQLPERIIQLFTSDKKIGEPEAAINYIKLVFDFVSGSFNLLCTLVKELQNLLD